MKSEELSNIAASSNDCGENKDKSEGLGTVGGSAVLVGLHACGELSCATIKLFASNTSIHGMCLISCCYHKMDTFPMSKKFTEYVFNLDMPNATLTTNSPGIRDCSCLKSPTALRLSSQEPFSR